MMLKKILKNLILKLIRTLIDDLKKWKVKFYTNFV